MNWEQETNHLPLSFLHFGVDSLVVGLVPVIDVSCNIINGDKEHTEAVQEDKSEVCEMKSRKIKLNMDRYKSLAKHRIYLVRRRLLSLWTHKQVVGIR